MIIRGFGLGVLLGVAFFYCQPSDATTLDCARALKQVLSLNLEKARYETELFPSEPWMVDTKQRSILKHRILKKWDLSHRGEKIIPNFGPRSIALAIDRPFKMSDPLIKFFKLLNLDETHFLTDTFARAFRMRELGKMEFRDSDEIIDQVMNDSKEFELGHLTMQQLISFVGLQKFPAVSPPKLSANQRVYLFSLATIALSLIAYMAIDVAAN